MTHTAKPFNGIMTSSTSSSTSSSTTTTTTTSSTTGSIPTQPGVLTEEQWHEIVTLYEGCGLGLMTLPVSIMIRDYVASGMSYEVIREAILETGFAPRPSAYYLRAVLKRASGDGIESLEEWHAAKVEYSAGLRQRWYRSGR